MPDWVKEKARAAIPMRHSHAFFTGEQVADAAAEVAYTAGRADERAQILSDLTSPEIAAMIYNAMLPTERENIRAGDVLLIRWNAANRIERGEHLSTIDP